MTNGLGGGMTNGLGGGMTNGLGGNHVRGFTNGMNDSKPHITFASNQRSPFYRYKRRRAIQAIVVIILGIVVFMLPIVALYAQTEPLTAEIHAEQTMYSRLLKKGDFEVMSEIEITVVNPPVIVTSITFIERGTWDAQGNSGAYLVADDTYVVYPSGDTFTFNINENVTENTTWQLKLDLDKREAKTTMWQMVDWETSASSTHESFEVVEKRYSLVQPHSMNKIDGNFAEWNHRQSHTDAISDVSNPNVDLLDWKYNQEMNYIKVDGTILEGRPAIIETGETVPEPPSGGGGGQGGLGGNQSGTNYSYQFTLDYPDEMVMLIDADRNDLSGEGVYGSETKIYIAGNDNEVIEAKKYTYNDITHDWDFTENIPAFNDHDQLEFSANQCMYCADVVIFMTGWDGSEDNLTYEGGFGFGFRSGGFAWGEPLGSITDMYAVSGSAVTIDGTVNAAEWNDADNYTCVMPSTKDMKIYSKRDSTYVYIGVEALNDTSADSQDEAILCFDTDHDATANPDVDDIRFEVNSTNKYKEGNGLAWAGASTPAGWVAARNMTDGHRSYEFRVTISKLNQSGIFWHTGDEIGMSIETRQKDGGNDYYVWYPDKENTNENPNYADKPDTWGDLVWDYAIIPEYQHMIIPIITIMAFNCYIIRRRKQHE